MAILAYAAPVSPGSSGTGITAKISDMLGSILGPDFSATLKKNPFILYAGVLLLVVVIWLAFRGGSGRGRKSGFLEGKKARRRRRKKSILG